jgi:hypothetical protein
VLDGLVAAIVAGPVSIDPLDWICPLLAVDADAFNHGSTSEFTAICAVARRHNDISRVLTTTPDRFEPMHGRKAKRSRSASLVPRILRCHAAPDVGLGATARYQRRQPRAALAHPAALS